MATANKLNASPHFRHSSHPVLLEKPCPGTLTKQPANHNPIARDCRDYVTLESSLSRPNWWKRVVRAHLSATRRQAVPEAFRRLHPLTLDLSTIPRSCQRTTGIKRVQPDQATSPSFLLTSRRLCRCSNPCRIEQNKDWVP